eukprot:5027983-Alexandrium_andersonii.AAC.1
MVQQPGMGEQEQPERQPTEHARAARTCRPHFLGGASGAPGHSPDTARTTRHRGPRQPERATATGVRKGHRP